MLHLILYVIVIILFKLLSMQRLVPYKLNQDYFVHPILYFITFYFLA